MQLQLRIGQRVRHPELSQRWSDRSYNDSRGLSHYDKSSDHGVVSGIDKPACGDVGELGGAGVTEGSRARGAILASNDRRVAARVERYDYGRLAVIGRRNPCISDDLFLGVSPVVVKDDAVGMGTIV